MDPKKSDTMRIALGRTQDAFNRVPFIEFHDGNITFQPGQSMRDTFTAAKAAFPPGARLEYRIETGDMYIDGDRGQALGRSLWVIKPDGTRELLVRGFNIYVDFELANLHLKSAGIPFQVMKVYEGPEGQHVETDVTPTMARSHRRLSVDVLIGTSSLWLGALAGLFFRDIRYVIAVGAAAFVVFAIATIRSSIPKRTAFLKLLATLPSYAGGYTFAVVCVRYFVGRSAW